LEIEDLQSVVGDVISSLFYSVLKRDLQFGAAVETLVHLVDHLVWFGNTSNSEQSDFLCDVVGRCPVLGPLENLVFGFLLEVRQLGHEIASQEKFPGGDGYQEFVSVRGIEAGKPGRGDLVVAASLEDQQYTGLTILLHRVIDVVDEEYRGACIRYVLGIKQANVGCFQSG
jgi:hypothetical protein